MSRARDIANLQSSKITADAGIDIDNINIDGTTIAISSGNLTVDAVAGNLILEAHTNDVTISGQGTAVGKFTRNGGNFEIHALESDKDIKFIGVDSDATNPVALQLDMSLGGLAYFNAGAEFGGGVTSTGLNSTSGTVQFADGSESFDSSDSNGYAVFSHVNGSVQLGLERKDGSGNSVGKGYIGANATHLFKVYNTSFATKFSVSTSGLVDLGNEINFSGYGELHAGDNTNYVSVAGGTNSNVGGNILLRGGAHSSEPNWVKIRNGSANAVVIDGNGKVLVGKNSSDYATEGVEIRSNEILITKSGANPLSVRNSADGGLISFNSGGSSAGSIGSAASSLYIGTDDAGILFNDHGGGDLDSILPYDVGSGALYNGHVDIGGASNKFRNIHISGSLSTGDGITFGSTSGNITSKTLDDYEEGSWTMTDQSGASLSLTVYVATYTKIGNQVFFEFGMVFPTTSDTNDISLSLPFTAISSNDNTGGGSISTTSSGRNSDSVLVIRNTAKLTLSSNLNVSVTNANFSGKQLRVAGQYTAA